MIDRHDADFQFNLCALKEMERLIPMTLPERRALRKWVYSGHEPETNPWGYYDTDGLLMNYIQAYRLELGYAMGPWDYWKGPEPEND